MQLSPNVYIDNNWYLTIEQPILDDYKIYGMSWYHGRTWWLKDRHTLVIPKILWQVKKYKVWSDGRFIELKQEWVEKE